ncbi:MAG: sigma-70 family RNA polymerase sigma factor [Faecalibacterium sp.]|nr:sigma-70 family RNA polymerase sigma factor [Ruminococcus sp.]MCM1392053.1 sigma-70 family RNA polymerase sigma factor [Ruminococcus sp.]MCM1485830.1 sigma-70 family RNA polymerase sigma factor [Faecalibacterium sp.]
MNDEQLLSLIQSDNSKGFDVLVSQYSALVFSICSSTLVPLGTKEDAEECASDVFVSFYRHIDEIDLSKGTIKGYLAVLAKRCGISKLRKLQKGKDNVSLDDVPLELATESDEKKQEKKKLVFDAVKNLGEPDSEIIIRRFLFGETAKEIAARLKMKPDAVQKRAKRAQAKLKILLGGVFYERQKL